MKELVSAPHAMFEQGPPRLKLRRVDAEKAR
jgi:hypothetical protein